MGGVNAIVINTASIPTVTQEIDASPGSIEIGKIVRCVGSEYPPSNSPKMGRPKIRVRRMPKQVMVRMAMILYQGFSAYSLLAFHFRS